MMDNILPIVKQKNDKIGNLCMAFRERLRQELEKKGVSPRGASLKMGLSEKAVTSYLNGSEPTLPVLKKMSEFFGVSIGYLVAGESDNLNLKNMRLAIWVIAYIIEKVGKPPKSADAQVEAVMSIFEIINEIGVIDEAKTEQEKLAKVIPIAERLVMAMAA